VKLRTRRWANERIFVLGGLALASALCVALEAVRELHYGAPGFRFLLWNLVLAWVPLLLALFVYDRYRSGASLARYIPALVLWLLFLPNAPYIVTDFQHLSRATPTPLWFDGVVISAYAWTGMLLGFVSLYLLHAVGRHRFGPRAGWCGVSVVLGLVSVGVYLGRFQRWNSWDLLVRPGQRLAEAAQHVGDPFAVAKAMAASLVLTFLLGLAYLTFYALIGTRLELRDPR
jgi:uncharacterized membrane protein